MDVYEKPEMVLMGVLCYLYTGERQSNINIADGKKSSVILASEAAKTSVILASEAAKLDQVNRAQGIFC